LKTKGFEDRMSPQAISPKQDLYEQITQAVIEAIESGAGAYRMPWHNLETPVNATSQKPYRGINSVVLWAVAQKYGYVHPQWATYRQWQDLGAQVRKGERSATAVFWKFFDDRVESETPDCDEEEQRKQQRRCVARAYHVFNAAQVDGYVPPPVPRISSSERIAQAEDFFSRIPAVVRHGGDRAFYSVPGDYIQMPAFEQFQSVESYYSVRGHESVHWSGALGWCNRAINNRFGSPEYAFEELVAELGTAFLCASLNIHLEPRTDHAPYIANWLNALRNEKRFLISAASKAQQVADYLHQIAAAAEQRAS
jgi:antirestriction protein ArdC